MKGGLVDQSPGHLWREKWTALGGRLAGGRRTKREQGSLADKTPPPVGPYSCPMPRGLGGSQGGGSFLMSEVPLQDDAVRNVDAVHMHVKRPPYVPPIWLNFPVVARRVEEGRFPKLRAQILEIAFVTLSFHVTAKVNDPVHFTGADSGDLQREDPRPDPTLLGEPQGLSRQKSYISRQSTIYSRQSTMNARQNAICPPKPHTILTLEIYTEKVCDMLQPSVDNFKVVPAKIPHSPPKSDIIPSKISRRSGTCPNLLLLYFSQA